ncbi:hypothetical protein [Aquimarina sp. I32.4]|uniref:hypothetical protein n=1 Tax=Aquimarina sp. I32.4 TaxID=2053903 RepID=UPI000CDF223C|nr:hypothetical protein [Aquimarina sp. I32.4]
MVFRNTIPIQNLKCSNCAIILRSKILEIQNISDVYIDADYSRITFNHKSVNDLSVIENTLTFLGSPPVGEKILIKNNIGYHCKNVSDRFCITSNGKL